MGIQSALHKHDKNSNQRHDQHARHNHTNVQHTITTVIIIITASMIVSDIYAIMNFYSELTSGGQISELILLY